jgi:hypothetical protein
MNYVRNGTGLFFYFDGATGVRLTASPGARAGVGSGGRRNPEINDALKGLLRSQNTKAVKDTPSTLNAYQRAGNVEIKGFSGKSYKRRTSCGR